MQTNPYQNSKFSSVEAIRLAQTTLLREHLLYAQQFSPAYQKLFSKMNCNFSQFELNDLQSLPFTEKKNIENDQRSFLAVSPEKVADIVLSSGTTGKAIQISYTNKDLERLAYNEEQSFAGCGIVPGDIALLTCTMDRCFIAGLAYFSGLRARGATVIRNGHGSIESHAEIIRNMKPTVIVGVPTFIKKLGLAMQKKGQNPANSGITKIICIGEPLRGKNFELLGVGRDLEKIWNAKVFSTYASSETATTFCECTEQRGGHLLPELAVIEIINEKGKVLSHGEIGEIVVTPLGVEGMPLVRCKTGDISFLEDSPCACGRFSPRLGPILGRNKQLIKVKGTSLYPQTIFSILDDIPDVSNYYIEVFREEELSERLLVHVALSGGMTREKVEEILVSKLRVKPEVIIEGDTAIKQKVFDPAHRKPVRFFDRRNEYVHA